VRGRGTMYTHVNKCKNDKIKIKIKERNSPSYKAFLAFGQL
jgi:hypothetical protein